jgi:hypothetical protein
MIKIDRSLITEAACPPSWDARRSKYVKVHETDAIAETDVFIHKMVDDDVRRLLASLLIRSASPFL